MRWRSGQHGKQHSAECVDVDGIGQIPTPASLFRAHVMRRPKDLAVASQLRCITVKFCQTKVHNLWHTFIDQHILGFQITVNDAA